MSTKKKKLDCSDERKKSCGGKKGKEKSNSLKIYFLKGSTIIKQYLKKDGQRVMWGKKMKKKGSCLLKKFNCL